MEDPDVDWKIEEYSSSSDYLEEEGKSNVKWILENGLRIGKKLMITGFVISSAPLVLPSVMVVSALGITVSVPFGLVFASYACTQKLLNKLLPIPTSSPFLEYDIIFEDEEERYGEPEEKEVEIEYINMEEEEKEQMEDIREGIEKRIELVKDENELPQEDDDYLKDIREDDEERLATGDETSKGKGYEEDVDEEGKEEGPGEVVDVKIGGVKGEDIEVSNKESKDEEPLTEVKRIIVVVGGEKRRVDDLGRSEHLVVVARGVGRESLENQIVIDNEQEDLKKGTVGVLEKIRDESSAGDAADKKKKKKMKKKGGIEKHEVQEKDDQGNAEIVKELETSAEKGNEHSETLVHKAEEDKEAKTNSEEDEENRSGSMIEDKNKKLHKVVEEAVGSDKTSGEGAINEYNLGSPVDDLADQEFSEGLENYQGNERATEYIINENMDLIEVPVTSGIPGQKHNEDSLQMDTSVPPVKESIVGDNKIWEQIDALRTIVGYRATPQKSYIDEVKALYIFTGVEPPSSFEHTTDLAQLNHKLRFLMAIVGVK